MLPGNKTELLPFSEKHLDLVLKWINQPDVRAGTGTRGPVSDYEHSKWYRQLMEDNARCTFVIGERTGDIVNPVGLTGLSGMDLRNRSAEYWIYIGEAASRRRGHAAGATILLLDFAFNTLGLHRIYLNVLENNLPALALYRKLGFVQEGLAREGRFWQGRYLNMIEFAMLEHEFRELSAQNRG